MKSTMLSSLSFLHTPHSHVVAYVASENNFQVKITLTMRTALPDYVCIIGIINLQASTFREGGRGGG